jgi:hypothetical protein
MIWDGVFFRLLGSFRKLLRRKLRGLWGFLPRLGELKKHILTLKFDLQNFQDGGILVV